MGKHSFTRRSGASAVTFSAATVAVVAATTIIPAHADEADDLLQELGAASDKATAKMEQIKELEDKIAAAQVAVDKSNKAVEDAQARLAEARSQRQSDQDSVNDVAISSYRTLQVDNVVNTLGSQTPQDVIDKTSYLGSVARNRQSQLDNVRQKSQEVIDAARKADVAKVDAQITRRNLEDQRKQLQKEQAEIDKEIKDVEARVDALTPQQRDEWTNQSNPVPAEAVTDAGDSNGVVAAALAQLGKPYGWGATGPDAFDCSGLMVWAYAQNGKSIPRTSQAQLAGGTPVSLSDLQPGDLIGYYPGVTHVGMYIGDGQVVHASDYGIPVQVVPVDSMPIQGAVRY